jgi:hypothetical protein
MTRHCLESARPARQCCSYAASIPHLFLVFQAAGRQCALVPGEAPSGSSKADNFSCFSMMQSPSLQSSRPQRSSVAGHIKFRISSLRRISCLCLSTSRMFVARPAQRETIYFCAGYLKRSRSCPPSIAMAHCDDALRSRSPRFVSHASDCQRRSAAGSVAAMRSACSSWRWTWRQQERGSKSLGDQTFQFPRSCARAGQAAPKSSHTRPLRPAHLRDGLFPVLGEIPQRRANHRLAQLITRAAQSSGRLASHRARGKR